MLKTFMDEDYDFIYLKWLLNRLNYVVKLQIYLKSDELLKTRCQTLWQSLFDANFIRHYCLPDSIPNLIDFAFYICFGCQLSSDNIQQITNSFQIHPFFLDRQWTNVKCLFDPIKSCQHLFSSYNNTYQFSHSLM